jgi:SAM-dependent methyltransferase
MKTLLLRLLFRTPADTDKNSQSYWNTRWSLNLRGDGIDWRDSERRKKITTTAGQILEEHGCESVLEIGCGVYVPLRGIANATHLDFSMKALIKSRLDSFICADITKRIPVPDKTFDATYSGCCLMHIPDETLPLACAEIERVTKKVVILAEGGERDLKKHFKMPVVEMKM